MADPTPEPDVLAPASLTGALRERAAEALTFHAREVVALALLAVLVLSGAGLAYVRARPATATVGPLAPAAAAEALEAGQSVSTAIFVHVVGAVRRPGVYEFVEGARVWDAVGAAGGLTKRADAAAVNMARPIADGEQVLVPERSKPGQAPGAASSQEDGLININTASADQLEALPGVGPVLAQRIVDHREANGPFARPEDLQKVSGIGPKTYESIAPHITV